ncbi:MAG: AbrB/MazE/SpoVT family DNA-binding domain-containing protein [Bryobacteraceae bacterium]|nr:AbrB/MazE/SpoVT family DNA-binding domain-containing protein [Bryobacteraceae bacterium]
MSKARVSAKNQIVIPKEVRDELGIKPGEEVHFPRVNGHFRIEKVPSLADLRGIWKGAPPFVREHDDRW